jgi:VWFA-related protein
MRPLVLFAARLSLAAALVLTSVPTRSAPGQAPVSAPPPAVPQTSGVTASRVAVDLVVRDKKGRLVRDLKPGEVEVVEDGVKQEILSLRFVDAAGGARVAADATPPPAPAAERAEPAPPPEEHPLFLAFLFDRLSPQARQTAHDAAIEWLRSPKAAPGFVGVFRIDQSLETLHAFTDDRQAAAEAVDLMLTRAPTAYRSGTEREELRGLRRTLLGLEGGANPGGATGSLPAESAGLEVGALDLARAQGPMARMMAFAALRAQIGMLEASEALERDQQGLTTVNSILALVNGLKAAPGRKAVVFFSEGLVLPPRVAATLQDVVAEANRNGVTFYAADAAGLRTISAADEARREQSGIVDEIRQGAAAAGGATPPRPMTKALERNEDMLRFDPRSGLTTLTRGTGGFLVSDTNAIARGLQAAAEDLGAYYLLEYAPENELWDGRFRAIEVKVSRPGVQVQARRGYYAVRTSTPTPLLGQEAPVLAALEMAPGARELAFRTAVVQVPDQPDAAAVAVEVEVPGDSPTTFVSEKDKRYQQDFTALVLVRDADRRVVRKLSRRYATAGPIEKADAAKAGKVLILRETWLPPGRYTVEVAVQDAPSGRLGVQRLPLEIAETSEGRLQVGSLVVVGHAAARGEGPAESPALVHQGMQIYPNPQPTFSLAAGRPIPFFLVAHPAAGQPMPKARVELRQGESVVFDSEADFTDAIGRSTLLGGVPTDGVAPGVYELRVSVPDGDQRIVRWAGVAVGP